MSHIVEPFLAQFEVPVAVYNFPTSQTALAQVHHGVAQRFETDKLLRQQLGLSPVEASPWPLQALEQGLPACSGVALSIDRLLALVLKKASIFEVMAFDIHGA